VEVSARRCQRRGFFIEGVEGFFDHFVSVVKLSRLNARVYALHQLRLMDFKVHGQPLPSKDMTGARFDILRPMRKGSIIRFAAALLLIGGVWLAHTQLGPPTPAKLDLVKVKDDLYVIHNELVPGNSTALITNDGVILVDDKFDVDHDGILAQLKKVTSKPIKYVINTHHHPDHSGGNAKMQSMDVQVVASQHAREHMVFGNLPGLPNMVFDHEAKVYLGGKVAELYYFGRAHTNGDIVVLFPADRVLASGDMFV